MHLQKLKKATRWVINKTIEENLDYLVRFALFQTNNKPDAEDIVHEAILKILEKDSDSLNPDSIRLYLFRIVHNLCHDYHRHHIDMQPIEAGYDIASDTDTDNTDEQEAKRINSLLGNLPDKEAEAIRMHVIDNLTFVEIGDIIDTPPSTVKSRYKSGMDKLKTSLLSDN